MSKVNNKNVEQNVNDKDIIERYIYDVTRRVPEKHRQDIRLELTSLIEDMCEEEGATVEEVLEKLGSPAQFAKRYRDENNYIIGPDYYDNYIWVLKVGALAIAISSIISAVVHGILATGDFKDFIKEFFKEGILTGLSGLYTLVGIVTIVFVILERLKVKVDIKPEDKWSPSSLPALPEKKALLSRGESIASIIIYVVLIGLFVFVPEIFGVFENTDNGYRTVSYVFNLENWSSIVPWFVVILGIAVFDDIVKIIYGKYCKVVMYSSIICNAISFGCIVVIFKFKDVWNPSFAKDLLVFKGKETYSEEDILHYWGTDRISNIIIAFIFVISCLEIGVTVYKSLKYSEK